MKNNNNLILLLMLSIGSLRPIDSPEFQRLSQEAQERYLQFEEEKNEQLQLREHREGPSSIGYDNAVVCQHQIIKCQDYTKSSYSEFKIFNLDPSTKKVEYVITYKYPPKLSKDGVNFLTERAKQVCQYKKITVNNHETFIKYKQKKDAKTYEKKVRPLKLVTGIGVGIIAGMAKYFSMEAMERRVQSYDFENDSIIVAHAYGENTRKQLDIFSTTCMVIGSIAAGYALYHGFKSLLNFHGDNYTKSLNRRPKKVAKEIAIDNMVIDSVQDTQQKNKLIDGGLAYLRYNDQYWYHADPKKLEPRIKNLESKKITLGYFNNNKRF